LTFGLLHAGQQFRLSGCAAVGLVAARVDDQLGGLLGNDGARKSIHIGQGDGGQQRAGVGQLVVDAGNGFLLEEVAQVLGRVTARVGLFPLGIGLFDAAQCVPLAALQFGLAKTKLAHTLAFLHQRIRCRLHAHSPQQGTRLK